MNLLYECIHEHVNELIKQRRDKISLIDDENKSDFNSSKYKKLFKCIDEINRLNEAIKNIEDSLKMIENIEYGN